MDIAAKRKRVVDEIFSTTGSVMQRDDPLVTAALYYSHEMREAGKAVAADIQKAANDLRAAFQLSTTAHSRVVADRAKLMRDIETQIAGCVKLAGKGQSSQLETQDFFTYLVGMPLSGL